MKPKSIALLLALVLFPAVTMSAEDRPNIVLIVTDNQSEKLLGAYGNDDISTPSIDRIAEEGMLFFHGLDDEALLSDGLNNTWDWLDKDLTLVTLPGVGHFVQEDAAERVSMTMRWWLTTA
ncbi:MAG: hypothetical protein DRR11_17455 [Gammaproteobacteria bacterium]|nr:MAG: hypothetical protein DRR11_17455 [Gammaproteobacteria bacterium]RLA33218.1 MAG: hypothetical protein DRR15_10700 [Gammaproteobacteria bacterium]